MVELLTLVVIIVCMYYITKEIVRAVIIGTFVTVALYFSYFIATNVLYIDVGEYIEVPSKFIEIDKNWEYKSEEYFIIENLEEREQRSLEQLNSDGEDKQSEEYKDDSL